MALKKKGKEAAEKHRAVVALPAKSFSIFS
jgi:hypothetical protein